MKGVDLRYYKLNSVNLAGRNLTPFVIHVNRDNDNKSSLKFPFANWFDFLFGYSLQAGSLTQLQLRHNKSDHRCFVELLHQPQSPTDVLLAFVNDNNNIPTHPDFIDVSDTDWFSHAVNLATPHIKAFYDRMPEQGNSDNHWILKKGKSYVIGRELDCHISLNDERVSRDHARIEVDPDGKITITDLGSSNGTFVNEERISGTKEIEKEDLVRFGKTTRKFSVKEDD
jgi:hypothetical protein